MTIQRHSTSERCIEHGAVKSIEGRYRTKEDTYRFKACPDCYKDVDSVVLALNNALYTLKVMGS